MPRPKLVYSFIAPRTAFAAVLALGLYFGQTAPAAADAQDRLALLAAPYNACMARCPQSSPYDFAVAACEEECAELRRTVSVPSSSNEGCRRDMAAIELKRYELIADEQEECDDRYTHLHRRDGCKEAASAFYESLTADRMCGYTSAPYANAASSTQHRYGNSAAQGSAPGLAPIGSGAGAQYAAPAVDTPKYQTPEEVARTSKRSGGKKSSGAAAGKPVPAKPAPKKTAPAKSAPVKATPAPLKKPADLPPSADPVFKDEPFEKDAPAPAKPEIIFLPSPLPEGRPAPQEPQPAKSSASPVPAATPSATAAPVKPAAAPSATPVTLPSSDLYPAKNTSTPAAPQTPAKEIPKIDLPKAPASASSPAAAPAPAAQPTQATSAAGTSNVQAPITQSAPVPAYTPLPQTPAASQPSKPAAAAPAQGSPASTPEQAPEPVVLPDTPSMLKIKEPTPTVLSPVNP